MNIVLNILLVLSVFYTVLTFFNILINGLAKRWENITIEQTLVASVSITYIIFYFTKGFV